MTRFAGGPYMKKGPGLSKTDLQVNLDTIGEAIASLEATVEEQAKRLASLGASFSAQGGGGEGVGASAPGPPQLSAEGEPVYIEDPGNPGSWVKNPNTPDPLYWLHANFTDQGPGDGSLVPRTILRVKLAPGTNRSDGEVQVLLGFLVTTPASADGVTPEVTRVLQTIVSLSQADCDAGFVDIAAPDGILVNDQVDAVLVAAWNAIGYSETTYAAAERHYVAGFGPPIPEAPTRTSLIRDQHHVKVKLRLQGVYDTEEPYTAPGCINLLESVEVWSRDNSGAGVHPDDTNADGWEQEHPVGLKRIVRKIAQQTRAQVPIASQARNVAVTVQRKHGKALWLAYRYRDRAGQVGPWGNVTPAVLDDDGKVDMGYAPPAGAYHANSFISWEDDRPGTPKTECSASIIVDLDGTMPKHKVIAYIQEAQTGIIKASEPAIVDETDTMVTLTWRRAFKKGNSLNLVKIEVAYHGLRTLTSVTGVSRTAGQDQPFTIDLTPANPSGAAPLPVSFQFSIVGGAAGNKSVDLDFGDGSAHYIASGDPPANPPQHTYTAGGTYLATAVCTDSAGRVCQAQSLVSAGIQGAPGNSLRLFLSADKEEIVPPDTVNFTATVEGATGAVSYVWKWKDGTPDGSGATPSHTFTSKGTFNVRCDITDAGSGMTAHANITIWAHKDKDPTLPSFVSVTSPAHDKRGTNAVECDLVAMVNCNLADTKALVLSCKDAEGSIHEKTRELRAADTSPVTITLKRVFQLGETISEIMVRGKYGQNYSDWAVYGSSIVAGSASTYHTCGAPTVTLKKAHENHNKYQFVLGAYSTEATVADIYVAPWGTPAPLNGQEPDANWKMWDSKAIAKAAKNGKTTFFTVVDNESPWQKWAVAIRIMSGPEMWSPWGTFGTTGAALSVTPSVTTSQGSLTANCQSTVAGGTAPYTFDWDFGDGSAHGVVEDPGPHTYPTWGQYHLRLSVTDAAGAVVTVEQDIVLVPTSDLSVVATAPASANAGQNVQFTGSTSGGDGSYSYSWDFGDGSSSSLQNPTHAYSYPGSYSWVLTVTDGAGKKGYAYGSISIATSTASTTLSPARISQDVQDPELPAQSIWYLNGTSGTAVPAFPTTVDNTNCQYEDANFAGNPGGVTKYSLGFYAQKMGGAWSPLSPVRGIKVRLKVSAEADLKVYLSAIGLLNSNGDIEPLSVRQVKVFLPATAGWLEFGHEEDKWGLPSSWFTEAQLESENFGVWLQFYCKATAAAKWYKLDVVQVIVYH